MSVRYGSGLAGLRELTRLKATMAAMNKSLAQMNKSQDGIFLEAVP
jgi:hypothetical protein